MRNRPTNSDDVIDSRDVEEAIEELESELEDLQQRREDAEAVATAPIPDTAFRLDEVDRLELAALLALREEAAGYSSDWKYGATLIRDSYFETYAQELAEDIGAINRDASWPNNHIDWSAAAEALQQDYTSVEFDGVTYWIR